MVSAATRSRAPKLLVRSPPTATRSKSRPNNATRDYLWIKKGASFGPARREKGWGTKRVVSQTSNKDIQMRPPRADPSVPRSPFRLLLPRYDTRKACNGAVAKEERDEQGRQSEERGRERAITLVFARLVPSARSLSLPSSLSAPSAPSASPSRTKKNWDLPEPARARETARKMGANLMLKRVGEGERAKKGLDEASKAKRK